MKFVFLFFHLCHFFDFPFSFFFLISEKKKKEKSIIDYVQTKLRSIEMWRREHEDELYALKNRVAELQQQINFLKQQQQTPPRNISQIQQSPRSENTMRHPNFIRDPNNLTECSAIVRFIFILSFFVLFCTDFLILIEIFYPE